MNIKILYDNRATEGFRCGWGFSALIDGITLFDTGEDAVSLAANMAAFGVEPVDIEQVVLSHEDWDHVGGVMALAKSRDIRMYVPAGTCGGVKVADSTLKHGAEMIEVAEKTDIDATCFVTARLGSRKKEISLCIRTSKGLVLVTGCAHPGLENIMKHVSQYGHIRAVTGGFHDFRKLKALSDVAVIVPCHCTRRTREILEKYPHKAQWGYAGMELDIGEET